MPGGQGAVIAETGFNRSSISPRVNTLALCYFYWVADFHIWGPGIRPNPSESNCLPKPNPSESGTHFCRVEMRTVRIRDNIL